MLHISIDTLHEKVPSMYSLIILASKRAHEMQEYPFELLDNYKSVKPIGRALEEVASGELTIK